MSVPKYLSPSTKLGLEKVPRFISNWLVIALSLLMAIIILIGLFISFPKKIKGIVKVGSSISERSIISKKSGQLKLLKLPKEKVLVGEVIGHIGLDCNLKDMAFLESMLINSDVPIEKRMILAVGNLQSDYERLIDLKTRLHFLKTQSQISDQVESMRSQKMHIEKKILSLKRQQNIKREAFRSIEKNFEIDKNLFNQKVLSSYDYNRKSHQYLSEKEALESLSFLIAENSQTRARLNLETLQLEASFKKQVMEVLGAIQSQTEVLKYKLTEWKDQTLLISPISGSLIYSSGIEDNMYLTKESNVLYVLPENPSPIVAEMQVDAFKIGSIKQGQDVVIKLDSYPYYQFGVLFGKVSIVNKKQEQHSLLVSISLPTTLKSSTGFHFTLIEDMTGSGEIIIQKQNLLSRIAYTFRGLEY